MIFNTDEKTMISTKICSSRSTCIKTLELRPTTRGKTSKNAVLPGFCKIERGGGSSTVVVLPAKNLQWRTYKWSTLYIQIDPSLT